MKLPKKLEEKRDELVDQFVPPDSNFDPVKHFAYKIGFNAATKLILESDELKGLVEGLVLADTQFEGLKLGFEQHGTNLNIPFHVDYCVRNKKWIRKRIEQWQKFIGEE